MRYHVQEEASLAQRGSSQLEELYTGGGVQFTSLELSAAVCTAASAAHLTAPDLTSLYL